MKVRNGTLIVKSTPEYWHAECDGGKSCTVRLVDREEWRGIADADPQYIWVQEVGDEDHAFQREITWMGTIGDMLGQLLVCICWEDE